MIIKSNDMKTNIINNMKNGNGSCKLTNLCDISLVKNSRLFSKIEIDVNSSIGLHKHLNETEFYYIIEGNGIVKEDEDKVFKVNKGDLVVTGHNQSHSIINKGNQKLVLIALIILDK